MRGISQLNFVIHLNTVCMFNVDSKFLINISGKMSHTVMTLKRESMYLKNCFVVNIGSQPNNCHFSLTVLRNICASTESGLNFKSTPEYDYYFR